MEKQLALLLPSARQRRFASAYVIVSERTQEGYWVTTDEGALRYAVYPEDLILLAKGDWDGQTPSEFLKELPSWAQKALSNLTERVVALHQIVEGGNNHY